MNTVYNDIVLLDPYSNKPRPKSSNDSETDFGLHMSSTRSQPKLKHYKKQVEQIKLLTGGNTELMQAWCHVGNKGNMAEETTGNWGNVAEETTSDQDNMAEETTGDERDKGNMVEEATGDERDEDNIAEESTGDHDQDNMTEETTGGESDIKDTNFSPLGHECTGSLLSRKQGDCRYEKYCDSGEFKSLCSTTNCVAATGEKIHSKLSDIWEWDKSLKGDNQASNGSKMCQVPLQPMRLWETISVVNMPSLAQGQAFCESPAAKVNPHNRSCWRPASSHFPDRVSYYQDQREQNVRGWRREARSATMYERYRGSALSITCTNSGFKSTVKDASLGTATTTNVRYRYG